MTSKYVLLTALLLLIAYTQARHDGDCMQFYRHDCYQLWRVKDSSFLCRVDLPVNSTGGHFGIRAQGNDLRITTDHELTTTLSESWSTLEEWD